MRNTVDITGIPVDKITMAEALQIVSRFLSEDKVHTIYTPNAEIMMDAYRNPELSNALKSADMLIADGAGVVLASRILGKSLPEKVAGFDLVNNTFSLKSEKKIKYFFFGGKPGVAEAAKKTLDESHPNIQVVGCRNGYFSSGEEKEIIKQINQSGADILLVCLGAPKQELWIHRHKNELKVKICIGVGGTLDVLAGNVQLAPGFFRRNGLEWLYRLYKEPWRYKRMLKLPQYVLLTLGFKLGLKTSK